MTESLPTSARDTANRLGSTLFLTALAHGVIILGVTFTTGLSDAVDTTTLKVTLVIPRADEPVDNADFIANQTQSGSSDSTDALRPTAVVSTFDLANIDGDARAVDLRDTTPLPPSAAPEQLVTSRPSETRAAAQQTAQRSDSARAERAAEAQAVRAPQSLAAIVDPSAGLPASENEDDVPGPSTRQSILANYLNVWRERVEQIGTLNFPREFLVGNTASRRPRLEVAIGPDGSLRDIIVQESSGDRAVDQAAVSILRLAAPFAPLPPEILAEYEMLRFAYEWDFIQSNR